MRALASESQEKKRATLIKKFLAATSIPAKTSEYKELEERLGAAAAAPEFSIQLVTHFLDHFNKLMKPVKYAFFHNRELIREYWLVSPHFRLTFRSISLFFLTLLFFSFPDSSPPSSHPLSRRILSLTLRTLQFSSEPVIAGVTIHAGSKSVAFFAVRTVLYSHITITASGYSPAATTAYSTVLNANLSLSLLSLPPVSLLLSSHCRPPLPARVWRQLHGCSISTMGSRTRRGCQYASSRWTRTSSSQTWYVRRHAVSHRYCDILPII